MTSRFEQDSFMNLELTPAFSTLVAACLRRGRNGAGVEIAVTTQDKDEVILPFQIKQEVAEFVDNGNAVGVCRVVYEAVDVNRVKYEDVS